MGFFSRLMGGSDEQKTAASEFEILAPVAGELIHLENTNDPAFSSRAVGDGVAVVPQEGTVCAPVSGTVAALFPTEHALGIMSDDSSAQVMLHIGIDTVKLEGKGFHALVAQGDHVDAGQPLVEVDFDAVRAAGFDPTVSLSCASARRTRLFVSMLPALLLLKSLSSGFPSKFLWWVPWLSSEFLTTTSQWSLRTMAPSSSSSGEASALAVMPAMPSTRRRLKRPTRCRRELLRTRVRLTAWHIFWSPSPPSTS